MVSARFAATIARLGFVRAALGLATINILWAIGSNILMHFYFPPGTFAGGWRVEVAVSTLAALLVTIPADIILIMLARSITKQRDALGQLVYRDHLTGLSNRRHFDEQVTTLVDRSGVAGVLILIDVDHFKLINDQYGHAAGDRVLSELGQIMRDSLRTQDLVGRLGGEEFGIFLPHASLGGAQVVAERLRERVAQHVIQIDGTTITLTISLGAVSTRMGDSYAALYRAADGALYSAKRDGRNRVALYSADMSSQPEIIRPTRQACAVSLSLLGEIS